MQHDSTNDADAASETLMLLSSAASGISGEGSKKRKHCNSSNLDGVKELRLTSSQAQQNRINNKKINANNKAAFKEACLLYKLEQNKTGPGKKKGAQVFCNMVQEKYNTKVSARTVQYYVNTKNQARDSPMKRSPDGGVSRDDFKILLTAYESYVRIKQIHAESYGNNQKLLARHVNNAMDNGSNTDGLFHRLQKECTTDFNA